MGMKVCAFLHACGISSSFSTYQESLSIFRYILKYIRWWPCLYL